MLGRVKNLVNFIKLNSCQIGLGQVEVGTCQIELGMAQVRFSWV